MADRLSQETVEALYSTTAAAARLSQETVEALYGTTAARARVSQVAVEVLWKPGTFTPRVPAMDHANPGYL